MPFKALPVRSLPRAPACRPDTASSCSSSSYALFIDDERMPPAQLPEGCTRWIIARTLDEVRTTLRCHGSPLHVSFDHDLGAAQPSGHEIAKALIAADLDARSDVSAPSDDARGLRGALPAGFTYSVHSMNPVGAENIARLMARYLTRR